MNRTGTNTSDEPLRAAAAGGGRSALRGAAQRLATLLFPVDPEQVRELVDAHRGEGREVVAERIITRLAGRSAAYGAIAGLPGGIAGLLLLGFDARGAWGSTATIAAAKHYHDDPRFFDREDWWVRTVQTALDTADLRLGSLGRSALEKVAVERGIRWGARRIVTRLVPIAGAVVTAGWNYVWVRREGRRIFASAPSEVEVVGSSASS